jgi:arylsulfatase A-like enzyme
MLRRGIALRLAILSALAWPSISGHANGADERRPNIIVILADDLGYGDLGVHGGKDIPTPNIDSIANGGVRFTSGYVSGPYCSPTRAGFLTSKYQQRFGHEFNPGGARADEGVAFGLDVNQTTLADRFKAAGYATALVGKWHLGNQPQFHPQKRGFDEYFGFLGGAHPYFPEVKAPANNQVLRGSDVVEEQEYLTDAFGREAVAYIDRDKSEPFFLYLAFNAVHNPQHAKPEHLEKFKSISDERRRTYAGMLTSLDENVGKVLEKLKAEKLDQNTLIAFFSDNGGPPVNGSLNPPLKGQKATTWEGGVRVPFFIQWPGKIKAGSNSDKPVIQLDLGPTLLAAAGAPVSDKDELDGVNLLPFIQGQEDGDPHKALYWRFGEQTAIRKGPWKLVKGRGEDGVRLYNLEKDIGETTDLSSSESQVAAELQADWDAWNKTLVEPKWIPGPQRANRRQAARR